MVSQLSLPPLPPLSTAHERVGEPGGPTDAADVDGPVRGGTAAAAASAAASSGAEPGRAFLARDDVAVLLLVAMRPGSLSWGWSRVVFGSRPLRHLPGLRFVKALGSGFEGGFGLRPSLDRQGLFLVFDGERAADAFLAGSSTLAGYRRHAAELLSVKLRPTSSRGSWSGFSMGVSAQAPVDVHTGPVAALTRASIRWHKAARFWPLAPASQQALQQAPGCRLAVGLGEAPVLRQATFSLWENIAAMHAYARSGAHLLAIRTACAEDFFSESMFTRFVPLQLQGQWKGVHHG